ncbi:MAG: hypothetical protein RL186_1629 [Pseudomonadota bacterium]|jgi:predicted lipid-binding transport protein (Tim44 family)
MEIIFFAVVAALVLGRLYQVLGQKRGAEPPPRRPLPDLSARHPARTNPSLIDEDSGDETNVVDLRAAAYGGPAAAGINAIMQADRTFAPDSFVDGAIMAYGAIVTAYGSGDEAALKPLVDQDVFEAYQKVMAQRRADNAPPIEVVRVSEAKITAAELDGKTARIDVAFSANLADGGDGLRATDEVWTFERQIDSRDPTWVLSAVQTK